MVKLVKYRGLYLTIKELKRLGVIRPREDYKIIKRRRKNKRNLKNKRKTTKEQPIRQSSSSYSNSFGSSFSGGGGGGGVYITPSSITTIQTEIAKENLKKIENENRKFNDINRNKNEAILPDKPNDNSMVLTTPDTKNFQSVSSVFNSEPEPEEVEAERPPDIPILINSKKIEDEPQIEVLDADTTPVKQRDQRPIIEVQNEGLELRSKETERDKLKK